MDEAGGLLRAAFAQRVGFGVRVGASIDRDGVSNTCPLREEGELNRSLALGHDIVECQILIPERETVVGLDLAVGQDIDDGGGGREGGTGQHSVVPEPDLGGGAIGAEAIEGSPVDPVETRRIDGLKARPVVQVEVQGEAGEIKIRQIADAWMFVGVVRIVENRDREIGGVAKDSANAEAGWRSIVDGCGRGKTIESTQGEGAVGLEFVNCFGHVGSAASGPIVTPGGGKPGVGRPGNVANGCSRLFGIIRLWG